MTTWKCMMRTCEQRIHRIGASAMVGKLGIRRTGTVSPGVRIG